MLPQALIREFISILGAENVISDQTDRHVYAYDSAVLEPVVPGLVLRPMSTEELGPVIALCHANNLPMTIRGSGTNLSGGAIPASDHSVVICTGALNRILEINTRDLFARVEPGVLTADFAAGAAAHDLFYPPDPGSQTVHCRNFSNSPVPGRHPVRGARHWSDQIPFYGTGSGNGSPELLAASESRR